MLLMFNPWTKAKEALAEARRIGEQLEVVSTGKSLLEHAHKAIVSEKAELEKEVARLNETIEKVGAELVNLKNEKTRLAQSAYELDVEVRSLKNEIAASYDAHGVLSQLAQSRLDKLNSAKSTLEGFTPHASYIKSNKALRVELAAAIKTIEETKETL